MRKYLNSVLICLTLLPACAFLKIGSEADPQLVQQLMQKSGLDKQIEQYPLMIRASLVQEWERGQFQNLTLEQFEKIVDLAGRVFNGATLKESVQKTLSAKLSEEDIHFALEWLNSPLGTKITSLEEAGSTPEALAASQRVGGTLVNDRIRVALIRKLDCTMKSTETAMAMSQHSSAAFLSSVYAQYPPEVRPAADAIMAAAEENSKKIKPKLEQLSIYLQLYAYQSLSNEELEHYVQFAQASASERYISAGHDGLNDALLKASRDFGAEVGKMFIESDRIPERNLKSDW